MLIVDCKCGPFVFLSSLSKCHIFITASVFGISSLLLDLGGTYSDGDENGTLFDAFHVCDAASFIGCECHDDSPAFGEDFDGSMVIANKNIPC